MQMWVSSLKLTIAINIKENFFEPPRERNETHLRHERRLAFVRFERLAADAAGHGARQNGVATLATRQRRLAGAQVAVHRRPVLRTPRCLLAMETFRHCHFIITWLIFSKSHWPNTLDQSSFGQWNQLGIWFSTIYASWKQWDIDSTPLK